MHGHQGVLKTPAAALTEAAATRDDDDEDDDDDDGGARCSSGSQSSAALMEPRSATGSLTSKQFVDLSGSGSFDPLIMTK